MTKEQDHDQRWCIYVKTTNKNGIGWHWAQLRINRRKQRGKSMRVYTWGSKVAALTAVDQLYGRDNAKVEPLPTDNKLPEYQQH